MPERDRRSSRQWLLVIMLAALAARLALWAWFDGIEPSIWDERDYTALATSLVERGELAFDPGQPTASRPPLYPAMVALVYAVAGVGDHQAVRLLQVLLNVALVPLVFALGRRLWDGRTGLWAAGLAAFYPSLWGYDYLILTEVLFTLLLCCAVLLLVRFFDDEDWRSLAAGGVVVGLATLTRSPLQAYPPLFAVLVLSLWRKPARKRWAAIGIFLVCFALPVAPWIARNSLLRGGPTPVDTAGLQLFELYNRPHLESAVASSPDSLQPEGAAGSEPLAMLGAMTRRIFKFWRIDRELVAAAARGFLGPLSTLWIAALAVVVGAYYALLALAGIFGMMLHPPRRVHLAVILSFVLAILAVHALVFGHSRYHVPVMPLVGLFSARLVVAGLGRPPLRRLVAAAALALALAGSWTLQLIQEDLPELRRGLQGTLHPYPEPGSPTRTR